MVARALGHQEFGRQELVAKMTSNTTTGHQTIPQWDGRSSSLETFEQKVKLYVMGTKKDERCYCAARLLGAMDPASDAFKLGSSLDTEVLESENGAQKVVQMIIAAQGPQTINEAVKLFRDLWRLHRKNGESMQKWTTRFQLHIEKTGRALQTSCGDIDGKKLLHPILQGMLLIEGTGLTPQETASVLATSGKVGKAGTKIGNSYDIKDVAESLIAQWSEDELLKRDKANRHRARADAANAWNLDELNAALPEYEEEGDEAYGVHDEEWPEEEYYDYEEGPDDEQSEDVYATGEEEDAQEAEVAEAYASASRTFAEAKDLLAKVRAARGYFPVVGVGVWDDDMKGKGKGKGQPTGKGKSVGRPQTGRGRGGGRAAPPPAKLRTTEGGFGRGRGAARGGRHHAGRGGKPSSLSPDQCLLCRQFGHRAADCPNSSSQSTSSGAKRAFGSFVGMMRAEPTESATTKEGEEEKTDREAEEEAYDEWHAETSQLEDTEEALVCFDMATLEGLGLIDGGATRTVGSVEEVQKLVDAIQAEGGVIEMSPSAVQLTYAGGDRGTHQVQRSKFQCQLWTIKP